MKSNLKGAIVEDQDAAKLVQSIKRATQVMLESDAIRERGETPTARQKQAWVRAFKCDKNPICTRTCGKCRVLWHRTATFHRSITDEEFEAVKAHFIEIRKPITQGAARRYVHETLRRRNAPYEGDTKLCIRMSREDLEDIKTEATAVSMTVQDFAYAALAMVDTEQLVEVVQKASSIGRRNTLA